VQRTEQGLVKTLEQRDVPESVLLAPSLPFMEPPCFAGPIPDGMQVQHTENAWFFVGSNSGSDPLPGRPEHTDKISHTGTWHLQLCGQKDWFVRPDDVVSMCNGCRTSRCPVADAVWPVYFPCCRAYRHMRCWLASTCCRMHGRRRLFPHCALAAQGGWNQPPPACVQPLKVCVKAGDLLLINTKLWFHTTELPPQQSANSLSFSLARDFLLMSADDTLVRQVANMHFNPQLTRKNCRPPTRSCAVACYPGSRHLPFWPLTGP